MIYKKILNLIDRVLNGSFTSYKTELIQKELRKIRLWGLTHLMEIILDTLFHRERKRVIIKRDQFGYVFTDPTLLYPNME
jgi:hypothetical protein